MGDRSVTSARHRQVVEHRFRKRLVRLALPTTAATLVTGGIVGVALAATRAPESSPQATHVHQPMTLHAQSQDLSAAAGDSPYLAERTGSFSRSAKRVTFQKKPEVKGRQYMTAPLNLWAQPAEKGKPLDVLAAGDKVAVTGVVESGFAQILYQDQVRWVNNDFLTAEKPADPATGDTSSTSTAGVSDAPCPDGSSTESGLTSGAVRLFRAVCNAFPALTTYGGYDAHGEHSSGKAIDFMINGDASLGRAVADWARAHASELDLYDVIYAQHIWTPERAGEGWRAMPDRGSATANHYDHVHISVN
jgi:hypothetical protein